jgi:hypothetical protein
MKMLITVSAAQWLRQAVEPGGVFRLCFHRTSVILPGVWRARSGSDIRSIHEAVNSS